MIIFHRSNIDYGLNFNLHERQRRLPHLLDEIPQDQNKGQQLVEKDNGDPLIGQVDQEVPRVIVEGKIGGVITKDEEEHEGPIDEEEDTDFILVLLPLWRHEMARVLVAEAKVWEFHFRGLHFRTVLTFPIWKALKCLELHLTAFK